MHFYSNFAVLFIAVSLNSFCVATPKHGDGDDRSEGSSVSEKAKDLRRIVKNAFSNISKSMEIMKYKDVREFAGDENAFKEHIAVEIFKDEENKKVKISKEFIMRTLLEKNVSEEIHDLYEKFKIKQRLEELMANELAKSKAEIDLESSVMSGLIVKIQADVKAERDKNPNLQKKKQPTLSQIETMLIQFITNAYAGELEELEKRKREHKEEREKIMGVAKYADILKAKMQHSRRASYGGEKSSSRRNGGSQHGSGESKGSPKHKNEELINLMDMDMHNPSGVIRHQKSAPTDMKYDAIMKDLMDLEPSSHFGVAPEMAREMEKMPELKEIKTKIEPTNGQRSPRKHEGGSPSKKGGTRSPQTGKGLHQIEKQKSGDLKHYLEGGHGGMGVARKGKTPLGSPKAMEIKAVGGKSPSGKNKSKQGNGSKGSSPRGMDEGEKVNHGERGMVEDFSEWQISRRNDGEGQGNLWRMDTVIFNSLDEENMMAGKSIQNLGQSLGTTIAGENEENGENLHKIEMEKENILGENGGNEKAENNENAEESTKLEENVGEKIEKEAIGENKAEIKEKKIWETVPPIKRIYLSNAKLPNYPSGSENLKIEENVPNPLPAIENQQIVGHYQEDGQIGESANGLDAPIEEKINSDGQSNPIVENIENIPDHLDVSPTPQQSHSPRIGSPKSPQLSPGQKHSSSPRQSRNASPNSIQNQNPTFSEDPSNFVDESTKNETEEHVEGNLNAELEDNQNGSPSSKKPNSPHKSTIIDVHEEEGEGGKEEQHPNIEKSNSIKNEPQSPEPSILKAGSENEEKIIEEMEEKDEQETQQNEAEEMQNEEEKTP